jgi:hypothetical protein
MSLKRLVVMTFGSIVVLAVAVSLFAPDLEPSPSAGGQLRLSPVPPAEEAEEDPMATLLIRNQTTEVICDVFIAQVGTQWGENRLQLEVINPGSSKQFSLPPGRYQLRVNNCFEYTLAEVDEIEISDSLEWTIASEGVPTATPPETGGDPGE